MIRHHDHPTGEVTLQTAVFPLKDLPLYGLVTTDANHRRAPPLCYEGGQHTKALLRHGHIRIIEGWIEVFEGRAQELCHRDRSDAGQQCVCCRDARGRYAGRGCWYRIGLRLMFRVFEGFTPPFYALADNLRHTPACLPRRQ